MIVDVTFSDQVKQRKSSYPPLPCPVSAFGALNDEQRGTNTDFKQCRMTSVVDE